MAGYATGYIRMAAEDALVVVLSDAIDDADIVAAFTTTQIEHPLIVVHATNTREMDETSQRLARFVDLEIRVISYAEASGLLTARAAHYALVSQVYDTLANADLVTTLEASGSTYAEFWYAVVKTDVGSVEEYCYVTTIQMELGVTPKGLT